MRPVVVLRWLTVLVVMFVAACATLPKAGETFPEVTHDFATRLRWGDYSGVAHYLTPENRSVFLEEFGNNEDLNIVDVRYDSMEEGKADKRATTCLRVEYYRLPSTVIKTSRFCLDWSYLGINSGAPGGWQVLSPIPAFK
jgi:hypothetical protein